MTDPSRKRREQAGRDLHWLLLDCNGDPEGEAAHHVAELLEAEAALECSRSRSKWEGLKDVAKRHQAERDTAYRARDYWREHYQAEANENTAIREIFGIDPEDPDETLTAERVQQWLADNTNAGDDTQ